MTQSVITWKQGQRVLVRDGGAEVDAEIVAIYGTREPRRHYVQAVQRTDHGFRRMLGPLRADQLSSPGPATCSHRPSRLYCSVHATGSGVSDMGG